MRLVAAAAVTAAISAKTNTSNPSESKNISNKSHAFMIHQCNLLRVLFITAARAGEKWQNENEIMLVFHKGIALVKCVICACSWNAIVWWCSDSMWLAVSVSSFQWLLFEKELPNFQHHRHPHYWQQMQPSTIYWIRFSLDAFIRLSLDQFQLNLFTHGIWLIKLNLQLNSLQLP